MPKFAVSVDPAYRKLPTDQNARDWRQALHPAERRATTEPLLFTAMLTLFSTSGLIAFWR